MSPDKTVSTDKTVINNVQYSGRIIYIYFFFAHHMHIWQQQVGTRNMLLRDIINVIYSIKYIATNTVYGQDMLYRL